MTNFHHFAGIGKMNCMPLNDFVNIVLFPIHVLINLIQKLGAYLFGSEYLFRAEFLIPCIIPHLCYTTPISRVRFVRTYLLNIGLRILLEASKNLIDN